MKFSLDIRIGDKDILLSPGRYGYVISYTVRNHLSRFPEWDELYWNVTGNDWEFPIEQARFALLFRDAADSVPRPLPARSVDVYTGKKGEKKQNFRKTADGVVTTTTPLAAREGLSVAYTWPRSLTADIPEPREDSLWHILFMPSSATLALWAVPLWLLIYFFLGRLLMKPVPMPEIIPLFDAPEGLSPGKLRYVVRRKYDGTAFAADLLHLVTKGAVSLRKGEPPVLAKRDKEEGGRRRQPLDAEERKALTRLFGKEQSVVLTSGYRENVKKAHAVLAERCTQEKEALLRPTRLVSILGAIQVLLLPLVADLLYSYGLASIFLVHIGIVYCVLVFTFWYLVNSLHLGWLVWRILDCFPASVQFAASFILISGAFFYALATGLMVNPYVYLPDGYLSALCACLLAWWAGRRLLPQRTLEGQKRLAWAKGLAMYLGTAERERFAALYPPEDSVERFEKLLPYALALDKGKTWANRFERYLEETQGKAEVFESTSWREVRSFRSVAVGATYAAAPRVFSSDSSSSGGTSSGGSTSGSGSSGGGSAGGGAGGGGGRGW
ncbi:membrane protein [Betaproteobacteria bacterium]|nr:membrane protein [Betaproteobacteria bacterium]